jgi:hypothetical protein
LEYKIQDSELLGDNKVVLEKFTLGKRVEAPNAVNLPLDLAIALLTDAEGKIDVAVPVRGNVDSPEFSYGHVVGQAMVNLITKIVTAPFRALANLLGGGAEQLDAIAFDPGSSRLLPPEREKLHKVVEALEKRPQLKLVVQGRFDPKSDGQALRKEGVRRGLAEEMGVQLSAEGDQGLIAFDNAKTQLALEKLLGKREGDSVVANFKELYEAETGKKAKQVNPTEALMEQASPDTAFYQAMFEHLVRLEPLADADLQILAQQRTEVIVNEVTTTAGLESARVTAGSVGPVEETAAKTVNTKLTLEVLKPATW